MRKRKHQIFDRLNSEYQKLKRRSWQGKGWFDNWFEKPLNNARLAAFSTYRDKVPAFENLLYACGGAFTRFYTSLAGAKKDRALAIVPRSCDIEK
jgi:predicted aminopeptidase